MAVDGIMGLKGMVERVQAIEGPWRKRDRGLSTQLVTELIVGCARCGAGWHETEGCPEVDDERGTRPTPVLAVSDVDGTPAARPRNATSSSVSGSAPSRAAERREPLNVAVAAKGGK